MKFFWVSTVTTLLMMITSLVQAEGLIQKLPEDGSWVEYFLEGSETDVNDPNDVKGAKGTLTISSVGTETVDGEKCRWIEIYVTSKQDNRNEEDQIILKLLIREKHLQKGKNPGKNIIRGWEKYSRGQQEGQVRKLRMVNSKPSIDFFNVLLVGPLENSEKLKLKEIETEKGKLKCAGSKGEFSFEDTNGNRTDDISGVITIRKHEKVPFGVVLYNIDTKEPNGDKIKFNLKLREYGKQAQSQLPDNK